ncbi:hypothetical protein NBRC116493_23510 [Aurantivibrio infirmus]
MQLELPSFDVLKDMAENDPEGLEQLRQQHVNEIIDNAPEKIQRRLRGLQFQIDAQRQLHPAPLAACIKISQMMYESFSEMRFMLNGVIEEKSLKLVGAETTTTVKEAIVPAKILKFQS